MTSKGDKNFGIRIKELREKKRYTQEQLAELIDIDARSLSRIETGVSFTTIEKLNKLSAALDVEVKDLFSSQHYDSKSNLIAKINSLLETASAEEIKTIYRVILSILR